MTDELKIPDFRLTENIADRSGVVGRATAFMLSELPLDKVYLIDIREEKERRRNLQNDLLFVWHKQYADHTGHAVKWTHAEIKYNLLLPLKLSAKSKRVREQAQLEKQILDCIPEYNLMIKAAYKIINSRGQPLTLFAEFLTTYQQHAATINLILESNKLQYDEAVYGSRYANKRAA